MDETQLNEMAETFNRMLIPALELYDTSGDFPAIRCNIKRILASLEMLAVNLEGLGSISTKRSLTAEKRWETAGIGPVTE